MASDRTIRLDISVSASDEERLQRILGPQVDATRVARLIAKIGAEEVLDQVIGKSEPRTLSEQRQHRLKTLLLSGVSLDEAEIVASAIFKITATASRNLIESTVARFDIELWDEKIKTAKTVLAKARFVERDEAWEISSASTLVRKWLKEESVRGNQPPPKTSGRGTTLVIADDTYRHLCTVLEITPRDADAER